MTTTDVERAAHEATVALADFDRASVTQVLQTVNPIAQALRELLAVVTAPTPPAADVREAVMNALACHRRNVTVPAFNRPVCSCGWASATVDYGSYAFDGHIADAVAAEVRPHGTVTDTEVGAAERVLTGAAQGDPWVEFEPSAALRAHINTLRVQHGRPMKAWRTWTTAA